MKKTVQNYIFISIGFTVILLFLSFHLVDSVNSLMHQYNWIARSSNMLFNTTYSEKTVDFFGVGFNDLNLLVDIIIVIVILLVVVMIFLKIYWSEKD